MTRSNVANDLSQGPMLLNIGLRNDGIQVILFISQSDLYFMIHIIKKNGRRLLGIQLTQTISKV